MSAILSAAPAVICSAFHSAETVIPSSSVEIVSLPLSPQVISWGGSHGEVVHLPHLCAPGVYVIIRNGSERDSAYVGMTGDLSRRLRMHEKRAIVPDRVIAITAADGYLDRADLGVLERLLFLSLDEHTDHALLNQRIPCAACVEPGRYLELNAFMIAARTLMLQHGLITPCVPAHVFVAGPGMASECRVLSADLAAASDLCCFRLERPGVTAEALSSDSMHILRAGSQIRLNNTPTAHAGARTLRQEALHAGALRQIDDRHAELVEDLRFRSFSAVTAFVGTHRGGGPVLWEDCGPVRPRRRTPRP